jgi:hypothetical protein
MHLDAEVVDVGIGLRQGADDFSRTEPNFEATRAGAARGRPPKGNIQIDRAIGEIQSVRGPEFGERAFLRRRDPAGAQHEAANATLWVHGRKVCLI